MNFQPIKLHLYLLLFSLTFILTCEDKITDSSTFGAVHVKIVFNNENNSVLNKSLSDDITSITITIPGVDPVNVYVSSGQTVSKTIDGVPVGQQTVIINLKNSAGTIVYTQTKTVQVAVGETSSPSFSAGGFTPENVSITVTSPNGGETWQSGTTHDITWNSSHSDLNIKIELYQGGSAYQTISSSQTNDGSYSWTIPSTYNEGSNYKVRISSVSDATVYDESDVVFTILPVPTFADTLQYYPADDTWVGQFVQSPGDAMMVMYQMPAGGIIKGINVPVFEWGTGDQQLTVSLHKISYPYRTDGTTYPASAVDDNGWIGGYDMDASTGYMSIEGTTYTPGGTFGICAPTVAVVAGSQDPLGTEQAAAGPLREHPPWVCCGLMALQPLRWIPQIILIGSVVII